MAEVIGIVSGLVALSGFGIRSGQILIQTLDSFQSSKKQVRELKAEVEALVKILESVQEACNETDAGFNILKFPVSECGKACKEFEAYISKHAPRSDQDRRSFRDWASITLRGDNIEKFKDKLAANKATITIALADANLRTTKVTADLVKEYQEMISATISDLQDRLETISDKLDSLPAQNTRSSNEYVNERKRIQEEIESTNQCLIICTEVSKHIGRIRPRNFKNISTASDANYESFITNIGPISANFTTDQTLESCDTTLHSHIQQLQNHLTEMSNRLKKLHSDSDTTSVGQESERQRIQDEFDSTKQSLALCIGASERATKNRLNVYEEVSIEEDGNQYIISTIGDLISAKKISAGARSVQCMGQLSDESFQKMLVHSTARSPVLDGSDTEIASGKGFEHRYGTGFKLEKQKYAVSGAE